MANLYTLENGSIQIDSEGNPITNIITPIVITRDDVILYPHIVTPEEEMRPDLVTWSIYGQHGYIDEIMTLNNIVDSLSIRQGDIIWFVDENDIQKLRVEPQKQTTEEIINSLVDPNAERKFDVNRETGENMLPSMKTTKLKQVTVNPDNNTITIINKFK
jgi:hypothetical protein